ncbi:MAG: SGNH/GDSL hydrolase family protein [candidate division KSB1 bacterium]|nr:SGNH/GDSL hydrolase family protein [candidate division KSB1 bacterium]MDQ7066260.1 SGNH/GDSL hydrolase family protein [candidate division KSB1 bacterium]
MRQVWKYVLVLGITVGLWGCEAKNPSQPSLNISKNQLVLSKFVAVGNSLTAGFQSAGMVEDFQMHSYPYLIAKQMGKGDDFQQPLIAAPGIGSTPGKTPLKFVNGNLVADDLTVDPVSLLKNALLPRPYDNLGVPGARLGDVLNTAVGSQAEGGNNPFFDIVLRNPNFGNTTQLQQAILLNPTLLILWIGNNDVLGAALAGGNLASITPQTEFAAKFDQLLGELRSKTRAQIVMANIPYVTDIPFINTLDGVFRANPAIGVNDSVPVIFDQNLQPVDFSLIGSGGVFIPLVTEETNVKHLTIPALQLYLQGIGVPDSAKLVEYGFAPPIAAGIINGMKQAGLNPTGLPLPGSVTITAEEKQAIKDAVDGFNSTLASLASKYKCVLVDMNSMLTQLNTAGIDGYSGKFVLLDPVNTAFSLDGVHPNSGGYAIVANKFIEAINQAFGLNIPSIDTAQFKGQYVSTASRELALIAVREVQAIFR